MKNFKNVFAFTFFRMVKGKGFIALTVIMAALFLFVPIIGMTLAESVKEEPPEYSYGVSEVFVCDKLGGVSVELSPFTVGSLYESLKFTPVESTESARTLAAENNKSLILVIETDEYGRAFNVIIPDGTALTDGDVAAFSDFVSQNSAGIILMKSDLTVEQLAEITRVSEVVLPDTDAAEQLMLEIIEMIAPMLFAFLLYFMIIFYGQSVSTSVISEKHSKLMDTMLISVTPTELVFGKMLSVSLAGISQLTVWILSLFAGFASGTAIVKAINPETTLAVVSIFEMLSEIGDLFTPLGIIVSLLFIVFGFLLYCSLSAIGGAISEKPEDLSSNNVLFTGIMAVSFLIVVFNSPLYTGKELSEVFLYIPFTAALTVPSQMLVGNITLLQAFLSLVILAVTTAGLIVLAGILYKTFALYKGKFPGIKKTIEILKNDKTQH